MSTARLGAGPSGDGAEPAPGAPLVVPARWRVDERDELVALACLPSMTPARLRALCALGGPRAAWTALAAGEVTAAQVAEATAGPTGSEGHVLALGRPTAALGRVVERWRSTAAATEPALLRPAWQARGLVALVAGDEDFPGALAGRPGAPLVVFCRGGDRSSEGAGPSAGRGPRQGGPPAGRRRPAVALTGTRSSTAYGEQVAAGLAAGLAARGVEVVTSLEGGIDAAVRAGAARASGGEVTAFSVAGADLDQPAGATRALLAAGGRVVSEGQFGTRPERWRFPRRNRLLALAGDVLLVVEAHATGGALHAAEAALEAGVSVCAVPGSVHSPSSRGTNALLADGAHVVRELDDLLAVLALAGAPAWSCPRPLPCPAPGPPGGLAPAEARVLAGLGEAVTTHLDAVLAASGVDLATAAGALDRLVTAGLVVRVAGGYLRAAPVAGGAVVPGGLQR